MQCSLNGVTTLRNKPHHGSRGNSQTRHCTRYGTLQLLRDAAPDQNGCTANISDAAPTLTSTTADETTAAPARAANNNPYRATLPSYQIEGSTPFESNPHRTRTQTRKHSPAHTTHTIRPAVLQVPARTNPSPQPYVVAHRKPQKIDSPQPS